jgi:hypothetical protein
MFTCEEILWLVGLAENANRADMLVNALATIRDGRTRYGATGFPVDFNSADPYQWAAGIADAAIMEDAKAAALRGKAIAAASSQILPALSPGDRETKPVRKTQGDKPDPQPSAPRVPYRL